MDGLPGLTNNPLLRRGFVMAGPTSGSTLAATRAGLPSPASAAVDATLGSMTPATHRH